MCLPSKMVPQPLTAAPATNTLAGGTVGHNQSRSESSFSASSVTPDGVLLSTALDALSDMYEGYVKRDRKLLDEAFETLVGYLEEMRDAVPKA